MNMVVRTEDGRRQPAGGRDRRRAGGGCRNLRAPAGEPRSRGAGAHPRRLQAEGPPAADSRYGARRWISPSGRSLVPGKARGAARRKKQGNRRRATMQGGSEVGLHFLLSRPTGAGAGGGTPPPQPGGPQPSAHLGRRRGDGARALHACPSCLPSGWDTSRSTTSASMPPMWKAPASSPR